MLLDGIMNPNTKIKPRVQCVLWDRLGLPMTNRVGRTTGWNLISSMGKIRSHPKAHFRRRLRRPGFRSVPSPDTFLHLCKFLIKVIFKITNGTTQVLLITADSSVEQLWNGFLHLVVEGWPKFLAKKWIPSFTDFWQETPV